jgi:GT2 family glycosyltransferase
MKLSIVIVNYNVKYFLEQCLDSVSRATENIAAEILVVDNHSSDGSVEHLTLRFPNVIFIANRENTGFSRANNQAITQTQGEYILLLNPDTIVGENSLINVCRFMDEHPEAGAVGVKMLDGYGKFLPESKRGFPSPWNSFCRLSGLSKLFPRSKCFGGYHLKFLDNNTVHPVDILAGAFMLVRKEAIEKSGGLDECFFMYGEDIDWSYRIACSGYTNYYFPEPIVHYKGESTKKDIQYVKHFYEAMLLFFNKHYPHSNRFFKLLIHLAIVASGAASALQKIINPFKIYFSKKQPVKEYTFDKSEHSYEQIIRAMEMYSGEKILFNIYHPGKKMTIASNRVIVDNTI